MSELEYRAELRTAVRGLWLGLDDIWGYENIQLAIHRQLPRAWAEGAKTCGVTMADRTKAEKDELRDIIEREKGYIDGLVDAAMAGSKANGGKLGPLFGRVNLWLGRYREVRSKAQVISCQDKKLKWIITAAESCESCLALAGKIKRSSQWEAADLRPQSPRLACVKSAGGIPVCKCYFEVTDEPMSKGRLPKV